MGRRYSFFWLLAACITASFAGGCCCGPCIRPMCINGLDRHYPGSNDCAGGGPCGDPEDVGGRPTGASNCETCAPQRQLSGCSTGGCSTGCSSCSGGCASCGAWFPWMRGFGNGGCGRFYWDEWWSDPPCKCEPCDLYGNYCGGTGICRSWRLGLPMPMLCRGGCGANPAHCGGSALSCWANNRKTCFKGCLNPCRGACGSGPCSSGGCATGNCHINQLGYDAKCDHCHGGAPAMPASPMPQPAAPQPAAPQPAPAPAPVPEKEVRVIDPVAAHMAPTPLHPKAAASAARFASSPRPASNRTGSATRLPTVR